MFFNEISGSEVLHSEKSINDRASVYVHETQCKILKETLQPDTLVLTGE